MRIIPLIAAASVALTPAAVLAQSGATQTGTPPPATGAGTGMSTPDTGMGATAPDSSTGSTSSTTPGASSGMAGHDKTKKHHSKSGSSASDTSSDWSQGNSTAPSGANNMQTPKSSSTPR